MRKMRTRRTLACVVPALACGLVLAGASAASAAQSEPNDTPAAASPLSPGSDCFATSTGAISDSADQDFWSVPMVAGERAWVATDTGGTQNAGGTSRDTVMSLYDTDGTTVLEVDDDGTGNDGDGTSESGAASAIAGRALPSTAPAMSG